MTRRTLAESMWNRTRTRPNGCLEWQGALTKGGYGIVTFEEGGRRTSTTAHRKYYELMVGKIPDGQQVNHRCDNPICINPDHMFLGTQADNIRDMIGKGRNRFYGKQPRRA